MDYGQQGRPRGRFYLNLRQFVLTFVVLYYTK